MSQVGGLSRVVFHLELLARPHPGGEAVVEGGPMQCAAHDRRHDKGAEPPDGQDGQHTEQVGPR